MQYYNSDYVFKRHVGQLKIFNNLQELSIDLSNLRKNWPLF